MKQETARQSMTARNGAEAIFEVLRGWGVDRVFTCPGSTEAAFLDGSLQYPDIAVTLTTHESIAVSMADGYARATGRPTVAYLHTNVGLANGIAHLYCAHLARSPVVILNGLKSTKIQNRSGFTTTPHIRDFPRQYAKWDWQTLRSDAIGEDLNRALKIAAAEPMGPTYLGIPQDLLEEEVSVPVPLADKHRVTAKTRPDPELAASAALLLCSAERPLIIAGSEVARVGAIGELVTLAERLEAPVVAEDRRTIESVAFPTDHHNYAGLFSPTSEVVQEADVIFLAGARTPTEFEAPDAPVFPPETPLIHLSSDAAELAKIYPTEVPLVCNAKLGLADLAAAVGSSSSKNGSARREFLDQTRAAYSSGRQRDQDESEWSSESAPISVPSLMHKLASLLDPSATIVDDAITSSAAVKTQLLSSIPCRYVTTSGGSLGWGIGAALGTKLAALDRRVVAIVGDGVFQFGLPGLWTAAHYGIPVVFVVINNKSYAAVKAALYRYGGQAAALDSFPGTDISGPHLTQIARGFGAFGQRVERLEDFETAFRAALEYEGPAIIEVMADPDDVGPVRSN